MDKALEYSEWVSSNNGEINKIEDKDWVNVYGIEEFSFDRDEDMRNIPGIDTFRNRALDYNRKNLYYLL